MQSENKMHAMVVDDSSAMRALLRMILRTSGFQVVEAANGRDALAVLAKSEAVELALIDWNMPEMGGFELLSAIRSNHSYDNMRIMMVTTETDLLQVKKALSCGADEYVMKPFNQEIIADKLRLIGF